MDSCGTLLAREEPVVHTLYLDLILLTTLLFQTSKQLFLFIPIITTTFHDCNHFPDSVLRVSYLLPQLILKPGVTIANCFYKGTDSNFFSFSSVSSYSTLPLSPQNNHKQYANK